MSTLGVIARADRGGLASLTYEAARHLRPDRVLLVDLGLQARGGHTDLSRFDQVSGDVRVVPHRRTDPFALGVGLERFVDGLSTLYTAETPYSDHLYAYAAAAGCTTVLHVMPELFTDADRAADTLWAPTTWALNRLPDRTQVVPVPVALDRFEYRERGELRTMFATVGEAMLDRNGWKIVQDALPLIRHPLTLLWRGPLQHDPGPVQVGRVTMRWLPPVDDYTKVIPAEADLLVLPRRYGGLCLPHNEAAAQGIPTLMTDRPPQSEWLPDDLRITAYGKRLARMKGGQYPVFEADPLALARAIDALAANPERMTEVSKGARAWAERHAWDQMLPDWQSRLGGK